MALDLNQIPKDAADKAFYLVNMRSKKHGGQINYPPSIGNNKVQGIWYSRQGAYEKARVFQNAFPSSKGYYPVNCIIRVRLKHVNDGQNQPK